MLLLFSPYYFPIHNILPGIHQIRNCVLNRSCRGSYRLSILTMLKWFRCRMFVEFHPFFLEEPTFVIFYGVFYLFHVVLPKNHHEFHAVLQKIQLLVSVRLTHNVFFYHSQSGKSFLELFWISDSTEISS